VVSAADPLQSYTNDFANINGHQSSISKLSIMYLLCLDHFVHKVTFLIYVLVYRETHCEI
jgi:hypothetical protein